MDRETLQLSSALLSEPVRAAVGDPKFSVTDWRVEAMRMSPAGNPVSQGLYRVTGRGVGPGGEQKWDLLLKMIQRPQGEEAAAMGADELYPAHWNYWRREPLVYQAAWYRNLPDGMAGPAYYGSHTPEEDHVWLWLELVRDEYQGRWPLDRYLLAAYHLGRLSGHFARTGQLPEEAWLSRGLLRQWCSYATGSEASLAEIDATWNHPFISATVGPIETNPFPEFLRRWETVVRELEEAPQTLCHLDADPANLFARHTSSGAAETVALDWALTGSGAVGEELAQLLHGVAIRLAELAPEEVMRLLWPEYLRGLADSGWSGDERQARFATLATAALRFGLYLSYTLDQVVAPVAVDAAPPPGQPMLAASARLVYYAAQEALLFL